MDRNFRVRVSVGIGMFAVALAGLYTFDGVPFKIIFGIFTLVAEIELLSFFKKKYNSLSIFLAILESIFLICGTIFVGKIHADYFWYIILGVPGYDIFAYLFGKAFGGKLFKKSRPFPHISKNKTWEGTILGLTMAIGMVAIRLAINNDFAENWIFLLCGPLALMGDLFESYLKRKFKVKDSNEILIKYKFFEKLEMLIGGSEGHGGFLDRVDSTAFTASVLLLIATLL